MQGVLCANARLSSPAPRARLTSQSSCSMARSTGELSSLSTPPLLNQMCIALEAAQKAFRDSNAHCGV